DSVADYHPQFSRFRGFAFFESDDPSLLPWNTSKTGVDPDRAAYRDARARMIDLMDVVIDYLGEYKARNASEVLNAYLDRKASLMPLSAVTKVGKFVGPRLRVPELRGTTE